MNDFKRPIKQTDISDSGLTIGCVGHTALLLTKNGEFILHIGSYKVVISRSEMQNVCELFDVLKEWHNQHDIK